MRFPLFAKPAREGSGMGISDQSIIHDEASLRKQVAYLIETYREPALVEQYIEGRDITVGFVGNIHGGHGRRPLFPHLGSGLHGYPPGTEPVYSSKLKVDLADLYRNKCPAPLCPEQADEIRATGARNGARDRLLRRGAGGLSAGQAR